MAEQPAKHGRDHLPSGYAVTVRAVDESDELIEGGADTLRAVPAAVGAGADLPYCWMIGGSEFDPVTVNTLTNPASIGAGITYDESFIHDPDSAANFDCSLTAGYISWQEQGEYLISCHTSWNGGATAGSTLASVLRFGNSSGTVSGSWDVTNHIIADAINETYLIPVTATMYSGGGFPGFQSVTPYVYHDDAGGQELNTIYIHVVQLNADVTGDSAFA